MFVVEHDERGGDDVADAPGAATPAAERFEGGLEQAVGAFSQAAQGAVDGVVGLLVDGELAVGGLLDRDTQQVGLAFVAQGSTYQLTLAGRSNAAPSMQRISQQSCAARGPAGGRAPPRPQRLHQTHGGAAPTGRRLEDQGM